MGNQQSRSKHAQNTSSFSTHHLNAASSSRTNPSTQNFERKNFLSRSSRKKKSLLDETELLENIGQKLRDASINLSKLETIKIHSHKNQVTLRSFLNITEQIEGKINEIIEESSNAVDDIRDQPPKKTGPQNSGLNRKKSTPFKKRSDLNLRKNNSEFHVELQTKFESNNNSSEMKQFPQPAKQPHQPEKRRNQNTNYGKLKNQNTDFKKQISGEEKMDFTLYVDAEIQNILYGKKITKEKIKDFERLLEKFADRTSINEQHTEIYIEKVEELLTAAYSADINKVLKKLNQYKVYAEEFSFPKETHMYEVKYKEIQELGLNLYSKRLKNQYLSERLNILKTRKNEALDILEKKATKNTETARKLQILEKIKRDMNTLVPSKMSEEDIENFRKKIDSVEDVWNPVLTIRKKIELENYLGNLESKLTSNTGQHLNRRNKYLKVMRKSMLSNNNMKPHENEKLILNNLKHEFYQFKNNSGDNSQKLNQLLSIKDRIEDISNDDDEIINDKQILLNQVFECFDFLNKDVAKFLRECQSSVEFCELNHYFKNTDIDNFRDKNSIEYVNLIRERAKKFESSALYFFGSVSSSDYYIVHENLLTLCQKLDKLNVVNDKRLNNFVVETILYIKNLLAALEKSAYNNIITD